MTKFLIAIALALMSTSTTYAAMQAADDPTDLSIDFADAAAPDLELERAHDAAPAPVERDMASGPVHSAETFADVASLPGEVYDDTPKPARSSAYPVELLNRTYLSTSTSLDGFDRRKRSGRRALE